MMIDIIGISFIPTYKMVGPFLFFMSLLLMVWREFLAHSQSLPEGYRGCGVWVFVAFRGMLFQVAVSPFTVSTR
jgi:hypothetical protein